MKRFSLTLICISAACTMTFAQVLPYQDQTLPIDERLYRVYEQEALRSGTFAIVRTKCDHGKAIHLTVYPDERIISTKGVK